MTKTLKKRPAKRHWRWRQPEQLDPGLRLAVAAAGGSMTHLAAMLGIRPQAVAQWDVIPIGRVIDVERETGIEREKLRPDMYPRRPLKKKNGRRS